MKDTKLKIADLFTLGNLCSGMFAIVFAINYNYKYAVIALIISVILDYLDGKIARLLKQTNALGKQLDSLADVVSFAVAPAVIVISYLNNSFALIASLIFVCAGAFRLARYNVKEFKGTYEGVPITTNGIIFPIYYFLNLPVEFYPYLLIIMAILMVSTFKVRKVK